MNLGTATILRADARTLPIADNSVDLIVSSPPYFALRSYQDGGEHYEGQIGSEPTPTEFVDALIEVTRECVRVLKPSGSLWVNLGDKYSGAPSGPAGARSSLEGGAQGHKVGGRRKVNHDIPAKSLMGIPWRYAIRCIDELGLILRAEVIWSKPNGLPESVTDRVRRSHEQWFHFTREPRYFSAVDEIREAHSLNTNSSGPARRAADWESGAGVTHRFIGSDKADFNPLGKLPGSVWTVPTEPLKVPEDLGVDHFAAFPTEWPKRIIQGWSPAGICVECGEGRRPVSIAEYDNEGRTTNGPKNEARKHLVEGPDQVAMIRSGVRQVRSTTITGYACACNEPIASPTGGRAGVDPSLETGRGGLNRPRGADGGTRVITRWEQRHEAEQLRQSPHRDEMATMAGPAFAHYIRTDLAGARPIPEHLRVAWREQGWLVEVPEYVPAPTTPAVVLDPFGGTGTTAMVAKALGRNGISVDMSADYCRLAEWRTNDRDQLAKVLGIAKLPTKPDEQQLDLFGEAIA